jgi:hypothetical protein
MPVTVGKIEELTRHFRGEGGAFAPDCTTPACARKIDIGEFGPSVTTKPAASSSKTTAVGSGESPRLTKAASSPSSADWVVSFNLRPGLSLANEREAAL